MTSVISARLLGGETFGRYGVIQTTIALFGAFIGTALGLASTKHVAQYRDIDIPRLGRIVGLCAGSSVALGVIAAGALFLMARPLALGALHDPLLVGPLRSASLLLLFHIWNGSQQGLLAGFEAFRDIAVISTARGILAVGLSLWALPHWDLHGAVWALTGSAGLACAFSTRAIRRALRGRGVVISWRTALCESHILLGFSLPAVLTGAVISPASWAVNVLLANEPGGYVQLGIFTAANHWRMAVCLIPATLAQVTMPVLSSLLGAEQRAKYTRTLVVSLVTTLFTALVAALLIAGLGRFIIRSYGRGFEAGLSPLLILQLTAVLTSVCTALGSAIATTGRMWASFFLNLMWAVMLLALVYFQHPRTAETVAWAYAGAYLGHTVFQALLLLRWHKTIGNPAWIHRSENGNRLLATPANAIDSPPQPAIMGRERGGRAAQASTFVL